MSETLAGWPPVACWPTDEWQRMDGAAMPANALEEFMHMPALVQAETVLRLSLAPAFTRVMARELSGRRDVGVLLDWLCAQQLCEAQAGAQSGFHSSVACVQAQGEGPLEGASERASEGASEGVPQGAFEGALYRWRAPARLFLRRRAQQVFEAAHVLAVQRRSADMLEQAGLIDDALELHRQSGDADAVVAMLWRTRGEGAASGTRSRSGSGLQGPAGAAHLLAQLDGLQPDTVQAQMRQHYLRGMCLLYTQVRAARYAFGQALRMARSLGDESLAARCEAQLAVGAAMLLRVPRAGSGRPVATGSPLPGNTLAVALARLCRGLYGGEQGGNNGYALARQVVWLERHWAQEPDAILRLEAGLAVFASLTLAGQVQRARRVREELGALLASSDPPALLQGWWAVLVVLHRLVCGEEVRSQDGASHQDWPDGVKAEDKAEGKAAGNETGHAAAANAAHKARSSPDGRRGVPVGLAPGGLAGLGQAQDWFASLGSQEQSRLMPWLACLRFTVALAGGQPGLARECLHEADQGAGKYAGQSEARAARQRVRARRHPAAALPGCLIRAWLALREGRTDEALACTQRAWHERRHVQVPALRMYVACTRVFALWQAGEKSVARSLLHGLEPKGQRQGHQGHQGPLATLLLGLHEALLEDGHEIPVQAQAERSVEADGGPVADAPVETSVDTAAGPHVAEDRPAQAPGQMLGETLGETQSSGRARSPLGEAFHLARLQGIYPAPPYWPADVFARQCLRALGQGIETGFVKTLIHRHGLQLDPGGITRAWPWPVKIHTLGNFLLMHDDVPVEFTGKAQRKPLDLVKAIIAYGGRGVDVPVLAGMLWPDAAGDAAQCSFDITLHRLRKLLHRDDAVTLSDRKVSLNARVVWTDTWEFTSLVNEALDLLAPGRSGAARIGGMGELESLSRQILSLYRADFLQTEEALPWVIAARDRYRSQWLRFIAAAGQVLLQAQRLELAIALYQQALESDPLAEELYQQLMRCYQRAGRNAEAIGVYRRCRNILSILLGMQPSERTTLIYRECLAS